jgi:hypothetical protein
MIRFDRPESLAGWHAINDTVMGGVSDSRIGYDPAGHAVFSGTVSFANNGGFASVRGRVIEPCRDNIMACELTVRGDHKTYKLSLRVGPEFDGVSYQARFQAPPRDWTRIRLQVKDFLPSWRGRAVTDAPLLDPTKIQQIGFLIADRQEGPFRLEIRSIKALRQQAAVPKNHP